MTFSPAPKPPVRIKEPKPLRAKNAKRAASTFARTMHSEERVVFVHSLPCIVPGCVRRDIECAHIFTDGMGRKAGYEFTVPACRGHHRTRNDSMHALSYDEFEAEHRVDLLALAADVERIWRRQSGRVDA